MSVIHEGLGDTYAVAQIRSQEEPVWRWYTRRELRSVLERAIRNTLSPRERLALYCRYGCWNGYSHTLKEVGNILGVSPTRAVGIVKRALVKLRKNRYSELVAFFEGRCADSLLNRERIPSIFILMEDAMLSPKKGQRLTPAEREVFALIGQGLNNLEISDKLFISVNTVRSHAKSIHKKTGIGDRVKLALFASKINKGGTDEF